MASDEQKNQEPVIKVTDRRSSAQPERPAEPAAATDASETVKGPGWEMREEKPKPAVPPMDFTTFCLSLASSALMHLGLEPYPDSNAVEKNLPLAKQTIDILQMLEEKTRGNLTADETKLLQTLLYDLRMRYVEESGR